MTDETRQKILEKARAYKGRIKYKFPNSPSEIHTLDTGMSCYHFVKFVLKESGIFVPDNYGSIELWEYLPLTDSPESADLVFTNGKQENQPHVGFYAGDTIIHSKWPKGVSEAPLKEFSIKGYRSIKNLIQK